MWLAHESADLVLDRPWAVVRRVRVDGEVAWLKECRPVQAFEPRLTAVLASRWPDRTPEVLAHDEERALLLLRDAGEPLGIGGDPAPWPAVVAANAELEHGESAHAAEHLAGGVPDRRLARMPALYERLLERDLPLGDDERALLRAFAPRFADLCEELAARGIPETIQHADLHGGNVYSRNGALRILDWGDSCVSHPFLTFRQTFVHLFLPDDDPWRARLRDAYLEPWGRPAELRETFELAQRLAPFSHVFGVVRVADSIPRRDWILHLPDMRGTLEECLALARR